jgi:hypothetical protein
MPACCFRKGIDLRRTIVILACCLALVATAVAAQRRERPYRPSAPTIMATPVALAIAGFDSDGDLQVARPEFDQQVRRSFAVGDSDGDGAIGLIELSVWAQRTLGNATAVPGPFNFDSNGDDKISFDEFAAEFGRRFAALDVNRDSSLTRAELLTFVAAPYRDRRDRRALQDEEQPPQR